MPTRVASFAAGAREMLISGVSFFGSAVYVPSMVLSSPPSFMIIFPSLVKVMVVPGGGLCGVPPRIPVSPTHSPTRDGGSFLGRSFPAGAPSATVRPKTSEYMSAPRSGLIGPDPFQGDSKDRPARGLPEVRRPRAVQPEAEDQGVAVHLIDSAN